MGKYTNMKNTDVFYKKDGKYYPIKKKSFAELNAKKKEKALALGEIKSHTVTSSTNLSGTPVIKELNIIGTGNSRFDRIGNIIKAYSLMLRGIIEQNVITDENISCRFVLFIDWQNQGALPVITDLFVSATEYNRNMARISDNSKYVRYTILIDKYMELSSPGVDITGTGNILYTYPFEYYQKIKHRIYYNSASADVAALGKGSLFLIVSDRIGSNVIRFTSTLKYTDP